MSADADNHAAEQVPVERLTAECPTHGSVPVHCPRCLGRRGGNRHKGTTWKQKKYFEAAEKLSEEVRRLLDLQPEARMLGEIAEARKKVYKIAEQFGWSKDQAELLLTDIRLNQGFEYLRELTDRMGMSPDERTKLREDIQRPVAIVLGDK